MGTEEKREKRAVLKYNHRETLKTQYSKLDANPDTELKSEAASMPATRILEKKKKSLARPQHHRHQGKHRQPSCKGNSSRPGRPAFARGRNSRGSPGGQRVHPNLPSPASSALGSRLAQPSTAPRPPEPNPGEPQARPGTHHRQVRPELTHRRGFQSPLKLCQLHAGRPATGPTVTGSARRGRSYHSGVLCLRVGNIIQWWRRRRAAGRKQEAGGEDARAERPTARAPALAVQE